MKTLPPALFLALLLPSVIACSSDTPAAGDDDDGDDNAVPPPDGDFDYVFPPLANSGFDGTNVFKVPLATNLTGAVTWEIEDPTILDQAPAPVPPQYADYGETWVMLITKKAGTTKVFAVLGDKRIEATVVVTAYDPAQVAAGAMRYAAPADATGAGRTACASCHQAAGGADHSPVEIAFFPDSDILTAITTGMYPDGYVLLEGTNHAWNVTDAEKVGIVPYLRSLPPRGF